MQNDFSGGPGFLAFVVTFSLVIVGVLLFRSLSKHLRKVRTREAAEQRAAQEAREARDATAAGAATAASSPEVSDDAEGGEPGGDQVTEEPGDR